MTEIRYVVGTIDEIPEGRRKIVPVGGRFGIGIFNVRGTYHALRNLCPHRGAPLCRGSIHGVERAAGPGPSEVIVEREGEIIRCPWHHREFDLATGRALYDPRAAAQTYPVVVEDDRIILILPG